MIRRLLPPLLALLAIVTVVATASAATQVWSGRIFAFAKAANANPALAANQDRITSNVWITRGSVAGIYNAKQETSSDGQDGISPRDTEWANGDAVNYSSLVFDSWFNWAQAFPPGTVGVNAVVHLLTDDIYIDIRFDTWGVGTAAGGSFSYHRATSGATPTRTTSWGQLKQLYR